MRCKLIKLKGNSGGGRATLLVITLEMERKLARDPTNLTYDILENWKKEHKKYPDLPIPLEGNRGT